MVGSEGQVAELRQLQPAVVLGGPVDAPGAPEEQQVVALQILNAARVAGQVERAGIQCFRIIENPAQMLIRQGLHPDIHVIFIAQAIISSAKSCSPRSNLFCSAYS